MEEIILLAGMSALAFAGVLVAWIMRLPKGTKEMQEISGAIQQGSSAYLKRQYKVVSVFAVVLAIVLGFAINMPTAVSFLLGAFLSALAGYIGMNISVRSNVRTAEASKKGLAAALSVAFRGGAVTGFAVVGLGLLGVAGLYFLYKDVVIVIGFGFGASLISLFARVGGGIFTKAADVGADLVGKIEKGIPEDDPRNPAVIADNVGDNVGDCAGMGADLFETYAVTAIAAMLLGALFFEGTEMILYPLAIGAVAIFASILGSFFVRLGKSRSIMGALNKGIVTSALLSGIGFYYVTRLLGLEQGVFYSSLVGLIITVTIVYTTDYWTSTKYRPVRSIAEASETGSATNIIAGLGVGMKSTLVPAVIISAGMLVSYFFGDLYGIAIAAMAMLSMTGIIVAVDSYGPITDNAGGIAEMTGLPESIRKITDALDAVGNTTKAVTKGFAIGSAALATLALFAAYIEEVELAQAGQAFVLTLSDPFVIAGLFIGGMIPFLFSAYLMNAVGKAAFDVVKEVRRQFREIPGIMERKGRPEYGKCVEIVTAAAQRELVVPALIAVMSPLIVGFILGPAALGGLLLGSIITGLMLAIMLTTGGAAWDNAKKFIEEGNLGGKGSDAHKAAVVGDTVGDPSKDTAGPALNPLIKVLNIIAILFISLIVQYAVIG